MEFIRDIIKKALLGGFLIREEYPQVDCVDFGV